MCEYAGAVVEQVLPVVDFFRCVWYSEYVCFAAEVFRRRERMQAQIGGI